MSNKDINLSRKSSQNPNSPTYVNDEEAAKSTGDLSVAECIRLARALQDKSLLPQVCKDYLANHKDLRDACVSHAEVERSIQEKRTILERKTNLAGPQLMRRWTSRENPLAPRRTQNAIAQKLVEEKRKKMLEEKQLAQKKN